MPYADLSFVTSTLEGLLAENMGRFEPMLSYGTTNRAPNEITPGDQALVSLYLHHVSQDGFHTNLPGPGGASEPAANPLALSLFYVVTVHRNVAASDPDRYDRERIFGHVIKTFHDNPVVHVQRPVASGLGPAIPDRIEIALRPVTPELANSFWSNSGWQTGSRLAAFYEVRIVLLEPEAPQRIPGPVLTIGSSVVQVAVPYIESTENLMIVSGPGGAAMELHPSPAQLSMDSAPAELIVRGTNLGSAAATAQITPPGDMDAFELPVEAIGTEELRVEVPDSVAGRALPVGFYTVRVRHAAPPPELSPRAESNKAVFAVVPTLRNVVTTTPGLAASFSVVPELESEAELTIAVGGHVLELRLDMADTSPLSGEPGVANRSGASSFVITMSDVVSGALPVRVTVDGVASRPEWLFA